MQKSQYETYFPAAYVKYCILKMPLSPSNFYFYKIMICPTDIKQTALISAGAAVLHI